MKRIASFTVGEPDRADVRDVKANRVRRVSLGRDRKCCDTRVGQDHAESCERRTGYQTNRVRGGGDFAVICVSMPRAILDRIEEARKAGRFRGSRSWLLGHAVTKLLDEGDK
jgi:hypothetical protein